MRTFPYRLTILSDIIAVSLFVSSCRIFSATCSVASAATRPKALSSYDAQVRRVLSQMTLEEKIGQLTQADQEHIKDLNDIERYYIGSVLSGGNSDPKDGNSLEAWTNLYDRCQQHALKTRLSIPILYGVDAVHGHSNVLGAVIFPHNIGLGCTRNPALVEKIGRITAREVRATGINWTFAPCVAVPHDERWGRTYEGFSEDPNLAKVLGAAAIRGLQGRSMSNPLSVLACAKHYVGDGGTTAMTRSGRGAGGRRGIRIQLDQGDTQVDEQTIRLIHLPPYIAAIEAGVGSIMPSYSSWNGVKCSEHKYLLTDILKNELGFEGFLISDYRAINQLDRDYKTAIAKSINAGMDMGMVPSEYKEFSTCLKELVEEGTVPMSRIDDAVTRILRVKFAMGLMDKKRKHLADRSLHKSFGSSKHRQVARQAVRQSIVILKNDNKTLPVSKKLARIHIGGKCADNIGYQCGGWTIRWQGGSGDITPGGTTILSAIKKTASKKTEVTFSQDGTGAEGADIGIVVIGERPYVEGNGDSNDLSLNREDIEAVNNIKKAGIPIVVVLISGRPMIINDVVDKADAFVAAWLPGTEGQGVADILFGDYKPTGKLSFTWPRTMEQIPINIGDVDYDPLFKFGFGLTY
ncbi:MAG: beta-glucosidase [Planctomycetes bacterium RBG_13_44_8b]|nr:MAG: beta-glucosidase [Planctomycetes bacterium RBG_13_44_8b]